MYQAVEVFTLFLASGSTLAVFIGVPIMIIVSAVMS